MPDYETLRLIWWLLLGVLLIGFAVMDGFDLGVATLLPFVARTDAERRVLINSVGPVWEGNQVWLILGAGAIFAAWPPLYATAFSGFYIAMLLALLALILRPVGFKFRSKLEHRQWRTTWDGALFVAGVVPAFIFGVALGNVLLGVPFHLDEWLRPIVEGTFLQLLTPFALLAGLLSVAMLTMHGAAWLGIKTEGTIQERARAAGSASSLAVVALFAIGGLAIAWMVDGYRLVESAGREAASNPLAKTVERAPGAWLDTYARTWWTMLVPALGFAGALGCHVFMRARRPIAAFLSSALGISGIIATVGVSMFPFIMPSSSAPESSLTVWDASSSRLTLWIMLIATLIFLPIIIAYTSWVYRVLRGKITVDQVEKDESSY